MRSMLRYSKYNHLVKLPDEDAYALLNFRTAAFARLTPLQKSLFDAALEMDEHSGVVQSFLRGGFVVSYDEMRHMRTRAFLAAGSGRVLGLTICPTLACNFACPYCFEEQRIGRMSEETREAVVLFARRYLEHFPSTDISVTWFGGEPLLCPDIIEDLSQKLMALAEEKGCGYHARLITNGWFITPENVSLLERVNVIEMQITLDGPTPESNDSLRREKRGGSSFLRIMENLERLHTDRIKVLIRCNVNKDNAALFPALKEKITALAEEAGFPVRVYPARMDDNEASSGQTRNLTLNMDEFHHQVGAWDEIPYDPTSDSFVNPIFCMAQNINGFAIDEQGALYKCWEAVGRDAISFGNVRDFDVLRESSGDMNAWDAYFETLFPENDSECMECKVFPICKGGCPHKRLTGRRTCLSARYDPDGFVLKRYSLWQQKNKVEKSL